VVHPDFSGRGVGGEFKQEFNNMTYKDLEVIYEDNHYIAINKPAGMLVQGDETGDKPLSEYVKDYIKEKKNKTGDVFLGVIHRLDRPVSGTVIFARTTKGLTRLNEMFKNREVKKVYFAITPDRPDPLSGHLTHFLFKDKERNVTKAYDSQNRNKAAKQSELDYKLLSSIGKHHLIKVEPISGRSHQIRVQLSRINCPIEGDIKYGSNNKNRDGSIHLHGRSLEFIHPVKKHRVFIQAEPPKKDQIWRMFNQFYG
jgi:23S rRNA pseudouridine1911/1915/1917 synthase